MAFLVVLESVTPAQRVAFVLHDVFGYPFAEVAGITRVEMPRWFTVGRSETALAVASCSRLG